MAMTSFDLGYGCGLFQDLKLIHLIPGSRVTEDYLLRMTEAQEYSLMMLATQRGKKFDGRLSFPRRLWNLYHLARLPARDRRFRRAMLRGHRRAYADMGLLGRT